MSVRLIIDTQAADGDAVAMYDSVTGWAFGPVFPSEEAAYAFIEWLRTDPRSFTSERLERMYHVYVNSRSAKATG